MTSGEDDEPIATPIEAVALELSNKADWRRGKARQYPDDERNLDAAELLDRLAGEVLVLDSSSAATAFKEEYEALFSGRDQDQLREIIQLWSDYRSGIGFRHFPDAGEEVLRDLIALAKLAP